MDHRSKLVALAALAFLASSVNAGYAQVKPPFNWQNVSGVASIKVAANDASFAGGVRSAPGVINVGGRAVTMPAAYRFAANAGTIAARAAFLNPTLFVVGTAAALAYTYFTDEDYLVNGGIWVKKVNGQSCASGCYEYSHQWNSVSYWGHYTPTSACMAYIPKVAAQSPEFTYAFHSIIDNGAGCKYTVKRAGWPDDVGSGPIFKRSIPPYNFSTTRPATQIEFETEMGGVPVPMGVPQNWPIKDFWWPVQPMPILNPSPGANPVPQPLRVPQGEPQLVPNSNPAEYKTPVIDITPSPTVSDPWRVDVVPKDITKLDPNPLPETEPVPDETPPGQEEQEKEQDLCEKNPEILACQKFVPDSLEPETLADVEKDLSLTPDTGWGPSSGSCPAPKTATIMGVTLSLPLDMLCDFALGIRPLLLAFAWLSAAMVFFGFVRK